MSSWLLAEPCIEVDAAFYGLPSQIGTSSHIDFDSHFYVATVSDIVIVGPLCAA
jgi:hypothetical protein